MSSMTFKTFKTVVLFPLSVALLTLSCTQKEELDADDLEPTMEWDEIVFHKEASGLNEMENEDFRVATPTVFAPSLSKKYAALDRRGMSPSREVSRRLALNSIENPFPYAGGILGTKGDSKYFIASTQAIPEFDRLYWVIVKVLSEKYSCFMRSKQDIGAMTRVVCKDKRQILFWKKKNPQYIEFSARQFDRDGFEIKVIRKKIVRISTTRVI